MADQQYEYLVHSQWAGWWGGYGAEPLIAAEVNARAAQGWRLVGTKIASYWWYGFSIWPPAFLMPRKKIIFFFERPKAASSPPADEHPRRR